MRRPCAVTRVLASSRRWSRLQWVRVASIADGEMPPLGQAAHFGRLGYHVRPGGHDLTTFDWMRFLDFAETLWR